MTNTSDEPVTATGQTGPERRQKIDWTVVGPELAEALEVAERWMMRVSGELLDGEGCRPQYVQDGELISAVLAKARPTGNKP